MEAYLLMKHDSDTTNEQEIYTLERDHKANYRYGICDSSICLIYVIEISEVRWGVAFFLLFKERLMFILNFVFCCFVFSSLPFVIYFIRTSLCPSVCSFVHSFRLIIHSSLPRSFLLFPSFLPSFVRSFPPPSFHPSFMHSGKNQNKLTAS